jgi:hypothetical protein
MASRFENPEEYLREKDALDQLDLLFLIVFAIELGINLFANWFLPFVRNPWSVFDLIVVGMSLIGIAPTGLPLSLVLLLRCCRVLRVFGRFKAVSSIFAALAASAVPLASTFFIIFVIASICKCPLLLLHPVRVVLTTMGADAVVGVTIFRAQAPDDFDNFSRAFISMFRITIGSVDWFFLQFPTVTVDGSVNWRASLFLITYVILINWFFFQVSIAVLFENFRSASKAARLLKQADLVKKRKSNQLSNPLGPLLLRLSQDFVDESDLTKRIRQLFKVSLANPPLILP